jgi:hypothetical protein
VVSRTLQKEVKGRVKVCWGGLIFLLFWWPSWPGKMVNHLGQGRAVKKGETDSPDHPNSHKTVVKLGSTCPNIKLHYQLNKVGVTVDVSQNTSIRDKVMH